MDEYSLPQIKLSVSRGSEFEACPRKWWLHTQARLKTPPPHKSAIFGTVLHAVLERYLNADDLGRDTATGEPVNLYPPRWMDALNRFTSEVEGTISPVQQNQVMILVEEAIKSGILRRRVGRQTEAHFDLRLTERTTLQGFIDHLIPDPPTVEDHKTTSNTRWLLNSDGLRESLQMQGYALAMHESLDCSNAPIEIAHIGFVSDPEKPKVRRTSAYITHQDIPAVRSRLVGLARRIEVLLDRQLAPEQFREIDTNENKACRDYGGCPYLGICWSGQTFEDYRKTTEKVLEVVDSELTTRQNSLTIGLQRLHDLHPPLRMETTMSLRSSLQAGKVPATPTTSLGFAVNGPLPTDQPTFFPSPPPPPTVPMYQVPSPPPPPTVPMYQVPSPPPPPPPAPAPPLLSVQMRSKVLGKLEDGREVIVCPWAIDGCKACGGSGFNSRGEPCPICCAQAQRKGFLPAGPISNLRVITIMPGVCMFDFQGDHGYSGLCSMPVLTTATSQAAPPPAQPQIETTQVPPADEPEEDESPVKNTGNAGRGRPAKSFMLLLNCAVTRNVVAKDRTVVYASEMLSQLGKMLAEQQGVPSFYDLDPFKRRDIILAQGEAIMNHFKITSGFVVCEMVPNGMSDLRALVDVLRIYAGTVVVSQG